MQMIWRTFSMMMLTTSLPETKLQLAATFGATQFMAWFGVQNLAKQCTRREDGMQNTDHFLKQLSSVPVLYAYMNLFFTSLVTFYYQVFHSQFKGGLSFLFRHGRSSLSKVKHSSISPLRSEMKKLEEVATPAHQCFLNPSKPPKSFEDCHSKILPQLFCFKISNNQIQVNKFLSQQFSLYLCGMQVVTADANNLSG